MRFLETFGGGLTSEGWMVNISYLLTGIESASQRFRVD